MDFILYCISIYTYIYIYTYNISKSFISYNNSNKCFLICYLLIIINFYIKAINIEYDFLNKLFNINLNIFISIIQLFQCFLHYFQFLLIKIYIYIYIYIYICKYYIDIPLCLEFQLKENYLNVRFLRML